MKHATSVRHTIYRESHGESTQDITLEGALVAKAQPINGTSLTGRQVHQALNQLTTNDWQRPKSDLTLQVESHEHAKAKHIPELLTAGLGGQGNRFCGRCCCNDSHGRSGRTQQRSQTMTNLRAMEHPLPWNRDSGTGVGVDFGHVPRYPGGYHKGIDMHAPVGEEVLAALDGVVIRAEDTREIEGNKGHYGIRVDIDHGDGLVTIYGHLNDWDVSVGDVVEAGKRIGWCGNTGRSSGPHLHFEIQQDSEVQDPMEYIKPRPRYFAKAWMRSQQGMA